MPTDVFISYTRADVDIADGLAHALDALALRIWWDRRLLPGDDIDGVIHGVLAETRAVVAVISPDSLASDWVMWELSQARHHGLCIVAILVRGVHPDRLPSPLNSTDVLVVSSDDERASLAPVAMRVRDVIARLPASSQPPVTAPAVADARRRLALAAAFTARQPVHTALGPRANKSEATAAQDPAPNRRTRVSPTNYSMSDGLVSFLERRGIAIAFTSPQSGTLFMLGRSADHRLNVHEGDFRQATGLHWTDGTLLLAASGHVHRLEHTLDGGQRAQDEYSHCFVPRMSHKVGALDVHDVGVDRQGDVVLVNTRDNCLATVSRRHDVTPIWFPPFMAGALRGDRCHLNGLAMVDGAPAYVTAASRSTSIDGWRDERAVGGIVMDVERNAIVCDGLSMPHSPHVHAGKLWLLNSGAGELGFVESVTPLHGNFVPVARCPGYARGLAFHGDFAIVGLSRPRYDDFAGFELERRFSDARAEAWCGIQIIEIRTGTCVEWFRIERQVDEIYAVAVLPNVPCPKSVRPINSP